MTIARLVVVLALALGGANAKNIIENKVGAVTCDHSVTFVSDGNIAANVPDILGEYVETGQILNNAPVYKQKEDHGYVAHYHLFMFYDRRQSETDHHYVSSCFVIRASDVNFAFQYS